MSHRRVVALLALGVLLGGCASPAVVPTTPPDPVVTSPPAPTPTAAPDPEVRVGATCEDFGELAAVRKLMPKATDVQLGDAPLGASLDRFVQQQYGSLDCWWTPGGIGTWDTKDYIEVTVAPETTNTQWGEIQALASGGSGVVTGGFTGEAYSNCYGIPLGRTCSLDDRIGGWYLKVEMHSSEKAAEGVSRKWGNPFLQNAVDVVAALPDPPARWQPESADPFTDCFALTKDGSLARDLGYTSADVVFISPTPQTGASWIAGDATGYTICSVQAVLLPKNLDLTFEILPGGSWAWDEASAGGTSVDGIGDAAVRFDTAEGTSIVFVSGSTLAMALVPSGGAAPGTDLAPPATISAQHLASVLA